MELVRNLTLLLARVLIAGLFIWDGASILTHYSASLDYVRRFGVPDPLLAAAVALQIGGGLMVVIGWKARLAALALAGFCALTAVIFHNRLEVPMEAIHFGKDLAIAGGFLFLSVAGAGRFSLDAERAG